MLLPSSLLLFPFISIGARQSLIGKNAPMFHEILSISGAMLLETFLACLTQSNQILKKFGFYSIQESPLPVL